MAGTISYLYDSVTGAVKNQVTKGAWPVRAVVSVDEKARQIYFSANGMYPGKDPYFVYYYRIDFDGSNLVTLTPGEGSHTATFSPDRSLLIDTYSRVDAAPVTDLRSAKDGSLITTLEKGDITALQTAGWKPPEVFVAKGRDGKTDIWGVIYRPTNFDAGKKYPVIENIYAGPQGSFVPKTFGAYNQMQAQADIGFIVVQIDGMGTNYRSKAFHDVAWKNLGDAGFPDRILWHKAVAAKHSYYDITRVGLYGTSAGGQNALGALLFFPDFYKAAVSSAGCHDNRMDKIWWNEQWMGWPIGPEYAAASNVDNAHRLQGKVLARCRRNGQQRRPGVYLPGGQSADQEQQGFRAARHSGRRPHQRRCVRRAQAVRLLREAPPRRQATGVESDRGSDQEAGDDGFDPVEAGFSRPCRPLNSTQGSIAARKACPLLRSTWIDGRWCSGIRWSSTNPS